MNHIQKDNVYVLPRGGIMARTSVGLIQVGASPETIKDTMVKEREVPQIYLLPSQLFSFEYGISTADFEFPMYYNFFLKSRKTFLIGQKTDLKKVELALREALFGPKRINITGDYKKVRNSEELPDLKKEISFFKYEPKLGRKIKLEDLVDFIPLNKGETFNYSGLEIINKDESNYLVIDGKNEFFLRKDFLFPPYEQKKPPCDYFSPPLFGITIIGSSHGFDPAEKTTGFIIWINRKGILVDPPVNSTRWLEENGINTKIIEDLILTHCHADHDSGALQKILEERRIKLHTTNTIKESFLNKYTNLTDIPHKFLEKLFDFKKVIIKEPHYINGAKFTFKYSFHSIPTIWFETEFQGKTFVYSADMFNHPPTIKELLKKKIMSKKRGEEFLNFPWRSSLVLHEAGIPPIHTPMEVHEQLDDNIKKNLYLLHVSEKSIPEGKGLKLAKSGIKNTIICNIEDFKENITEKKVDLISKVDLFEKIDINKIREIADKAYYQQFSQGDYIIKAGDEGDKFYIIESGIAVIKINKTFLKTFSNYDYFGETSIVFNIPRNADVYANTNLSLLVMDKKVLLELISGSKIKKKAKNLAIIREMESWELFNKNPILKSFSVTQKTELQSIMKYERADNNEVIIENGDRAIYGYLIKHGTVKIYRDNCLIHTAEEGELLAKISFTKTYPEYSFKAVAGDDTELFRIDMAQLNSFLNKNPGMKVKLIKLYPFKFI